LEAQVESWLKLRGVIAQAIEPARQQKLVGNALEAAITLHVADQSTLASLQACESELEEFFILSDLKLVSGSETIASLVPTQNKKCQRCWRHRPSVGQSAAHPELCDRCEKVVS